ncbi:hypothetical protein HYDPIDRAFT_37202 [Hydnomerulius pinastri MD-312]|nr:hypothetical protein HYDPIDRAFT_37202 [Hydnomerulius pinastri MD-312]
MSHRDNTTAAPTLYFKDNILSVPGYTFEKASLWHDTGSSTLVTEGSSLKDGGLVLAKIAPAHSTSSTCLEREAHILGKVGDSPEALSTTLRLIEFLTVPRADGDCVVLLLVHPGPNLLARYFPSYKVNDFLLPDAEATRPAVSEADMTITKDTSSRSEPIEEAVETEMQEGDLYDGVVLPLSELDLADLERERFDVMDLASFLEFAIQATHCLEMVHRLGFVHREVRANAFHLNMHSGVVRLVHFGNRAISLEEAGGPSQLVIASSQQLHDVPFSSQVSTDSPHTPSAAPRSESAELPQPHSANSTLRPGLVSPEKVIEALHYLAPEQVSSSPSAVQEDHRADLYSLGMLFWTCVVGRGRLPFALGDSVSPAEVLAALGNKRPPLVGEVRSDVPCVIGDIIDKLLSKSPDARYQSAYGLKADLLECQKRLLTSVSEPATLEQAAEIIPAFEIGLEDKYSTFIIPHTLFGRDKELETLRNVIRHSMTSFARSLSSIQGHVSLPRSVPSTGSQGTGDDDDAASASVQSNEESPSVPPAKPDFVSQGNAATGQNGAASPIPSGSLSGRDAQPPPLVPGITPDTAAPGPGGLRKVVLERKDRSAKAHTVIIIGPGGAGKSSLVLANQAKWKAHGLWAQAKFQAADNAPFAALLSALSSALRQLTPAPADTHLFIRTLTERLGPQLANLPLLFAGAPDMKAVFEAWGMNVAALGDSSEYAIEKGSGDLKELKESARLATSELTARFQSLVESVFAVITEVRSLALFLDDLHEADATSLDLVQALINSRSRLLIFATMRPATELTMDRIRSLASHRARVTWITLEQLSYPAISNLVAKTLHRTREECLPLSRLIHTASGGNVFLARNMLAGMQRHHYITFDWGHNHWQFDIAAIESSLVNQKTSVDPTDQSFLISHFRDLPQATRKYLVWASFFGTTFKVNEVALLIDWEDSSGSSSDEEGEDMWNLSKAISILKNRGSSSSDSMRGLQGAINEGWLVQRGREMCSFAHNRYRQAVQQEASTLPGNVLSKMSFRIVLAILHDAVPDVHRIAEHARRCIPLLREQANREELLDVLIDAGHSAWARGAHELAFQAFWSAKDLLSPSHWIDKPKRSCTLFSRLAELCTWKGDLSQSESIIAECIQQAQAPEDHAQALRLRANNHFMRNEFADALENILMALHILGVDVNSAPTKEDADKMFEEVKGQILAIGFEEILKIPRTMDPRIDLAVSLLNDAGTNSYWSPGEGFIDVIGMTTVNLALKSGISPGTSLGFFWVIGAAAERRELFRFSADLGKLALRIAYMHGGSTEKCRATVLYAALVAPFDNAHLRTIIPLLADGLKHGHSSGDRAYTAFAAIHTIAARLFTGEHLSELVIAAEECTSDVEKWTPAGDPTILSQGILNCIKALGGYTDASSIETVFNTHNFDEPEYQKTIAKISGNQVLSLSWYNAYKVVGLYCTGFFDVAAELGFMVFETRSCHPNHRHSRFAAFFHSLALITCVRRGDLTPDQRLRYLDQVTQNQAFIRKWISSSPVNTGAWIALVEAEMASLSGNNDALRFYDMAVNLATTHEWHLEEGLALYLQGSHLVRSGVDGLGTELQHRGVSRQSQWGALGLVRNMIAAADLQVQRPPKRPASLVDAGVQTDVYLTIDGNFVSASQPQSPNFQEEAEAEEISVLSPSDLIMIIQRSKEISDCLSLSSALQRLTEITSEICRSEYCCIVITSQIGEYGVATILNPPEMCQVFENPKPLRSFAKVLQVAAIQSVLDSKQSYHQQETLPQSLRHTEDPHTSHRSVICLPISSNRGHTLGALYVAGRSVLSASTVATFSTLCQQASVSISSALLFRSVQAGTRENLKMIASQREALEAARKSREDAIKATRVKSRFIANMSHEMRTPFSSFYGLLDLLSGTELNTGQREIVETAKQSCEILLKIIDSILDYSKLEASAMKLDFTGFPIENVITDCMELFLPLAAKKLDLSYNIEENVPKWIFSDHTRIRQILMNLIGNAVKFTASGSVTILCSVDHAAPPSSQEIFITFAVRDTGIGLSPDAAEMLFVPFQQADNSSTRRFGGTGLGLSISRQLVKLLGGTISVDSTLGIGSTFWFTLPVKLYDGEDSRKASLDLERLQNILSKLESKRVIVCSPSSATRALLHNILKGFDVIFSCNLDDVRSRIADITLDDRLDFVILDVQFDMHIGELIQHIRGSMNPALQNSKIIHLYTPTTDTLSGSAGVDGDSPGVFKMIKPPREARLLQILTDLMGLEPCVSISPSVDIAQSRDAAEVPNRTLYGNILIAEDNAVAQTLLIKQLERYQLKITATSDGAEAIQAWESHEPGYYSLALFDHHMPVCDGIEATKKLRKLESTRCPSTPLPVVALSADAQESTKQFCLSAGMDLFLSKPLRKSDLLSLLSTFGQPILPTLNIS